MQHLVGPRHGEVRRRGDLAQVAHGRLECRRRRPAFVDIERAAVVEHEAEVVVAAGRVVPRQPVAEHRRLFGEKQQHAANHLLVRAQHALRVDHALRPAGRSRREQDLRDRVRADPRVRLVHGRRRAAWRSSSANGVAGIDAGADDDTTSSMPGGSTVAQRALEARRPRRRTPAPGCTRSKIWRSVPYSRRLQRIGGRDRRVEHAAVHRGERQQAVLDAVAGQDDERPLARQAAVEQRLRQTRARCASASA